MIMSVPKILHPQNEIGTSCQAYLPIKLTSIKKSPYSGLREPGQGKLR